MGKASLSAINRANSPSAEPCGNHRRTLRTNSVVMLHAHDLWPKKTAARVAEITGYAVRTVEDWDASRARIPADALAALLQSEWGRGFLAAVMADQQPRWWMKLKAFFNALDVMTMQRVTRRKLKDALDADAAFSLPHAAFLQDEEFFGAQPAPPRQSHRSVVGRKD
jgi:hypothetical protein